MPPLPIASGFGSASTRSVPAGSESNVSTRCVALNDFVWPVLVNRKRYNQDSSRPWVNPGGVQAHAYFWGPAPRGPLPRPNLRQYENTLDRKYITLANKKLCKNKPDYCNYREATERYAERLVLSLNDCWWLSVCLPLYLSVSQSFCLYKWNSHLPKFSE